MANKFTYQVLRDTTTDAVIKLTGTFDGTSGQEANTSRISANSLYGALDANSVPLRTISSLSNTALSYYDIQITGVKAFVNFSTTGTGSVEIYWSGAGNSYASQYANSATIFHFNSNSDYGNGEQVPSILNNSGLGVSANSGIGDIGVSTFGAVANSAYTLIVSVRKNNAMYQRGQFNDPAAFNFGTYKVTP
jgi:hypothetical protein